MTTGNTESCPPSQRNKMVKLVDELKIINEWSEKNIESCIKNLLDSNDLIFANFGKPMRYLLTNHKDGPSISSIISILGKDLTFFRINNYLSNLIIHK